MPTRCACAASSWICRTRPIDSLNLYRQRRLHGSRVRRASRTRPARRSWPAAPRRRAANPPSAPGTPGGFSPAVLRYLRPVAAGHLEGGVLVWPRIRLADAALRLGRRRVLRLRRQLSLEVLVQPVALDLHRRRSGYSLANFRAGFALGNGWDVYGWVRNAFDKEYFDFLSTQSGSTGLVVGQPGDPRTYGLTVNKSF